MEIKYLSEYQKSKIKKEIKRYLSAIEVLKNYIKDVEDINLDRTKDSQFDMTNYKLTLEFLQDEFTEYLRTHNLLRKK